MRIIYILLGAALLSTILLWLGAYKILRRKLALLGAGCSLLTAGALLLLAVLPGNSFYGKVITQAKVDQKLIALTFDDGPYPPYTQRLLKVLKEKKIKATFFLVGENLRLHPEIAKEIQADGHEIALHAGSHQDLLKANPVELQENIALGKKLLKDTLGITPRFMRPPHGFKDWLVLDTLQANQLTAMNWSVIPRDWTNPGSATIATRVVEKAHSGAIVLLHDGDSPKKRAPRQQTVEAVTIIIDELQAQGYKFVTASQLLEAAKP